MNSSMNGAPYRELQSDACRLLSLPGELRNRIYDHCVEPETVASLAFSNLRYTCRAVYQEFTPLYLARTTILLRPSEVERYLSVFYPSTDPSGQSIPRTTATPGTIISNIHGNLRIDCRHDGVLDLMPFVQLRSRVPEIRIALASRAYDRSVMECAERVIRSLADPSCAVDLQCTVERILFRWNLKPEIVVMLHGGVLIEQLAKGNYHQPPAIWKCYDSRRRRWTPARWLQEQGLPVSFLLEAVMESSEGVLREPKLRGFQQLDPQRQIVYFRRTKGRSRIFKRTPSMEAMLNSWLPPAPLDVADELAGFEQLSTSDTPPP